ncbi:hypothetical protein Ahy_B05g077132 [Arachis hypogaea]|uniref:Uncharacterized protein n=1 Tax=Arachis hypogaea TaxID=3818 RepID=A0A444Z4E3_ARAHY|nr:hypothetical protein Ahy_B05g077132 [Arachis hypogaea]
MQIESSFQANALSMSSASSDEGTAPQANGITRRLRDFAKEVQPLAKEAAETVVLVFDEEGVESLISELVKGINEPKLLWSSYKNCFLVLQITNFDFFFSCNFDDVYVVFFK